MITKAQAETVNRFHYDTGAKCQTWRRNGRTTTWKTRPEEWSLPLKYGLYDYTRVREWQTGEGSGWHTEAECPRA